VKRCLGSKGPQGDFDEARIPTVSEEQAAVSPKSIPKSARPFRRSNVMKAFSRRLEAAAE
jgi:hypothetical protein